MTRPSDTALISNAAPCKNSLPTSASEYLRILLEFVQDHTLTAQHLHIGEPVKQHLLSEALTTKLVQLIQSILQMWSI